MLTEGGFLMWERVRSTLQLQYNGARLSCFPGSLSLAFLFSHSLIRCPVLCACTQKTYWYSRVCTRLLMTFRLHLRSGTPVIH